MCVVACTLSLSPCCKSGTGKVSLWCFFHVPPESKFQSSVTVLSSSVGLSPLVRANDRGGQWVHCLTRAKFVTDTSGDSCSPFCT